MAVDKIYKGSSDITSTIDKIYLGDTLIYEASGGTITDLTGKTWVGNSYISSGFNTMETEFTLNFNSNSLGYTSILLKEPTIGVPSEDQMYYGSTKVYDNDGGGWQNNNYKTVTFTGGTDVTNTDLITWLEANGTLTPPARYIQTTTADFNASGDYTGVEEYIILPADKPSGYNIVNLNVKGVATSGDYLTDMSTMFYNNNSLYLELEYLNTSNVTDMSTMFYDSQATTIDLSSFDTSNVTNMSYMFYNSQATTLDLSSFDTSNVTDMSYMFRGSQATTLDLSSFDTSNVTNMNNMFNNSQATTGYARTQTDANKFNSSSNKPSTLTFVVK